MKVDESVAGIARLLLQELNISQSKAINIAAKIRDQQPASPAANVRGMEEIAEELWDKHSKMIDDDISSLSEVASTDIITRSAFKDAILDFQLQYASQSGYTLAQVSDAWDRGQSYGYAQCQHDHGGMSSDEWNYVLDKQTFLNSLKTPEIK
jgi:hypothetical protein